MSRTTQIDGLSIFHREAGPKDAPTLLLVHGLPSSSRMFEPLFSRLSDFQRSPAHKCPALVGAPASRPSVLRTSRSSATRPLPNSCQAPHFNFFPQRPHSRQNKGSPILHIISPPSGYLKLSTW